MIVTAVERQRRGRRVNVSIDGRFALALGAELAVQHGVRPGRELTPGELSALAEAETRRSALEAALSLLSYRPRSEKELRDRLREKRFDPDTVEKTIGRLRELGYVDDVSFARFWTETRQTLRPRSRRLLVSELRRRGVSGSTADEATVGISDEEAAYEAAGRQLRALQGLDYRRFRERLGRFLTRRGFGYDVARRVIERCWTEIGAGDTDDEVSEPSR